MASALSRGSASHASSVLLAPETYFRTANAEVRQFDALIALETLVALAGNSCPSERELICEALDRIASGRPLGAKGIYRGLHDALAAEFVRNGPLFRITNNATDWVFVDHPSLGKGVRARYRISEGLVELRINKAYPQPHLQLPAPGLAGMRRIAKNTETHFKLPPLAVSAGARANEPTASDLVLIRAAMQRLVEWWELVSPTSNEATAQGRQ